MPIFLLAASTLAIAPVADTPPTPGPQQRIPQLRPTQAMVLRCGVVFAVGAKMQAEQAPGSEGWPTLASRGKEFFVQVTARLMDETGANREQIAALAMRQVPALGSPEAISRALPGCLPLLDAAGL